MAQFSYRISKREFSRPKISSRITKNNPGPPENLDKGVFTADTMRDAQK